MGVELDEQVFAGKGWDILKRHIRYMDHFPYLPQDSFTDRPEQDLSSMSLQIAAGAGIEAIIFGTFGVKMEEDRLSIQPYNHEDIGEATLREIPYNGRMFGIRLNQKQFSVYEGEKLIATGFYCEKVVLPKQ